MWAVLMQLLNAAKCCWWFAAATQAGVVMCSERPLGAGSKTMLSYTGRSGTTFL